MNECLWYVCLLARSRARVYVRACDARVTHVYLCLRVREYVCVCECACIRYSAFVRYGTCVGAKEFRT